MFVVLVLLGLALAFGYTGGDMESVGTHSALIEIDGTIESGGGSGSADSVIPALNRAFSDASAVGVILRINSPGGSPVQAGIVADAGETEIVKSPVGAGWTTSVAGTECVVPPLVPVIVKGYVPGLIDVVSTDNVDDPEPVIAAGVNVPFAKPVWDRLTELENPLRAPTETV